jgi:hypothetical protein
MSSNRESQPLELLLASVDHLSSPPELQIEYLESLGAGGLADELGLEFDDVYEAAVAQIRGDSELRRGLEELNHRLQSISGEQNGSKWSYEALRSAPEWQSIRALAAHVRTLWGS